VAGHIFQARPVWIYTQSNITNIIFTWVHNTNTEKKKSKYFNICQNLIKKRLGGFKNGFKIM
jgi:hypothetical protein